MGNPLLEIFKQYNSVFFGLHFILILVLMYILQRVEDVTTAEGIEACLLFSGTILLK